MLALSALLLLAVQSYLLPPFQTLNRCELQSPLTEKTTHVIDRLVPRASKAAKEALKKAGPAIEKWALNPQSMTDRDQRKENRENAVKVATGNTGGGVGGKRHPEMQKAMDTAKHKPLAKKK